jgi:hypothetical protein
MKAHFILIAICIIALPTIYFINSGNHWSMFIPLGYLNYSLVVGLIGLWNSRNK